MESTGVKFYGYDDLPLRTYIEVAKTENYFLLINEGSATYNECFEVFEKILRRNSKSTGNFDYLNYFETLRTFNLLINQYNLVKACLLKISIWVDLEVVNLLNNMGYKIPNPLTCTATEYNKAVYNAGRKSDSITTKIITKQKQMDVYSGKNSKEEPMSVAEIIAPLVLSGSNIDENITLAMFNAINKSIKKQNNGRTGR